MNGESKQEYSENAVKLWECSSLQMDREVELVHKRLTWALTFQGFLFTAVSFSIRVPETALHYQLALLDTIPIAGGLSAFFTLLGVTASAKHRTRIRNHWETVVVSCNDCTLLPPFYSPVGNSVMGRFTSYGILVTLIFVWAYLFFRFHY